MVPIESVPGKLVLLDWAIIGAGLSGNHDPGQTAITSGFRETMADSARNTGRSKIELELERRGHGEKEWKPEGTVGWAVLVLKTAGEGRDPRVTWRG